MGAASGERAEAQEWRLATGGSVPEVLPSGSGACGGPHLDGLFGGAERLTNATRAVRDSGQSDANGLSEGNPSRVAGEVAAAVRRDSGLALGVERPAIPAQAVLERGDQAPGQSPMPWRETIGAACPERDPPDPLPQSAGLRQNRSTSPVLSAGIVCLGAWPTRASARDRKPTRSMWLPTWIVDP